MRLFVNGVENVVEDLGGLLDGRVPTFVQTTNLHSHIHARVLREIEAEWSFSCFETNLV